MPGRILGDGTRIPILPFSDYKNRFFCMKNHCNALFFTADLLAVHERFCHSNHPLGGESPETEQRCNRKIRANSDDVVMDAEIVPKEQSEGDRMYQTMLKMSSQFFDKFLGKARREETPAEGGEEKNSGESI